MDCHMATANKWYSKGDLKVVEPLCGENACRKHNGFRGLLYWLPNANPVATVFASSSEQASVPHRYPGSAIS